MRLARTAPLGLTALLLVVPALAGCLGGISAPGGTAALDDRQAALDDAIARLRDAMVADHDHQDPAAGGHDVSAGLELVGYDALIGEDGSPGAYTDIDLWTSDDGAERLVLINTKVPLGGFVVADVSDPADPAVLSWYKAGDMYDPDVKWSPDGRWAVLATHGFNTDPPTLALDHESPIPYGIHLVDVSDRSDPAWSSYIQCGASGVHNVNVAEIGGGTWVFGACYDSFVNRVVIGQIVTLGDRGLLVRTGEFSLGSYVEGNRGSVHDMVVTDDPVTGDPVLTVSYGSEGIVWVDVSDPMDPQMLGQWKWEDDDHVDGDHPHFLHYAELYHEEAFGRRITVAGPEYLGHDHTGQFWIVDATSWDDPRLLSSWEVADDIAYDSEAGGGYLYSPHNFKMRDGHLFIAHNHAGVWAVDFASTEDRLFEPRAVGVFAHAQDPGHDVPIDFAPDVWGIDVDEDHVYASDRGSGLYVLELAD